MKIEEICIGGWFQRTILQLTEVYDFVRDGSSRLDLDKDKLKKLHSELNIKNIEYGCNGLEYIYLSTLDDINVKIFEDGLIVLSVSKTSEKDLNENITKLSDYYSKKLSPALSYIFSLGAPIPKELANIATVYPYFIVLDKESKSDIKELLNKLDKERYYEYESKDYDVLRGNMYYFVNNKQKTLDDINRYIEEQIFIR